jgi:hypothetical protein
MFEVVHFSIQAEGLHVPVIVVPLESLPQHPCWPNQCVDCIANRTRLRERLLQEVGIQSEVVRAKDLAMHWLELHTH